MYHVEVCRIASSKHKPAQIMPTPNIHNNILHPLVEYITHQISASCIDLTMSMTPTTGRLVDFGSGLLQFGPLKADILQQLHTRIRQVSGLA